MNWVWFQHTLSENCYEFTCNIPYVFWEIWVFGNCVCSVPIIRLYGHRLYVYNQFGLINGSIDLWHRTINTQIFYSMGMCKTFGSRFISIQSHNIHLAILQNFEKECFISIKLTSGKPFKSVSNGQKHSDLFGRDLLFL